MLIIKIPGQEYFVDSTQEFVYEDNVVIKLEHSLKAISEWESKWKKPFISEKEKSYEETLDYIRCMILDPAPDDKLLDRLSVKNYDDILAYIKDSATATWFKEDKRPASREVITSEIVYYWMTLFNIPFECENWNINRLTTLIRVCGIKSQKAKKMDKKTAAMSNIELNRMRRQSLNTRG